MIRLGFFIFLFIFLAIYGSAHWAFYALFTKVFTLASPWGHILKGFFAFSGALFLIVRVTPLSWKPLAWWANVWFGIVFIGVTFWLLQALPLLLWKGQGRAYAGTALGLTALISIFSLIHGAFAPRLKPIALDIPGAPSMTVAQISDVHLNRWTSIPLLEGIVDKTMEAKPDLIVITGDLTDERNGELDFLIPSLRKLKAPLGVYAIPGNHEFYTGIQRAADLLQKADIRFLRNEWLDLPNGWVLAGIDDPAAREMSLPVPKPAEFLATLPKGKSILLMNHRPLDWDAARAAGVKLQLSGHLHAGQIPPMDAIVFLAFKYPCGLYTKGDAFLYTTSGAGFWGPPMRFIIGAEIPVFRIN